MYAPFLEPWLAAFPRGVLAVRAEDFFESGRRMRVLQRAWAHIGLRPLADDDAALVKVLSSPPPSAAEWLARRDGGGATPATLATLRELYAPYNERMHSLLAADGASCTAAECDAFLWEAPA